MDRKTIEKTHGLVPFGDQRQRSRRHDSSCLVVAAKGRADGVCRQGVTFDTGGISLKPAGDMDHMKWDMSGAGLWCSA